MSRACAAIAFLVLALAGCGGSDATPLLGEGKAASVHGAIRPDVHLFGEPVVATVDVVLDRDQVSPGDVALDADFKPYEMVGETVVSREDIGRFTHLRYVTRLRCLDEDCIPRTIGNVTISQTPELPLLPEPQQRDEKTKFQFPPATVTAKRNSESKVLGRVVWPPVRSLSRINWYDDRVVGQGFPFVATVTPLPDSTYRISPRLLALLLIALAVALVGIPVGYLVQRRRARREPKADRGSTLSPLERALALVEWASKRPSVDERREALEALAYELDTEADATAAKARAHGWSPPTPEADEMTELVSTVREDHASAS